MSKGQKRSNREAKKPKQPKSEKKTVAATNRPGPEQINIALRKGETRR
jgi:hypothetical protein